MIQKEYIKQLIENDDKIFILNEFINKVSKEFENTKTKINFDKIEETINLTETNIYIEY